MSNTYITLNEDEKRIINEYDIANIFNIFFIVALNLIKDTYVTLATFLTQLKKLYKNIKLIQVSLSSKFNPCKLLFMQPIKATAKRKNWTIDRLVFCQIDLKFMNGFYMNKCILILVTASLNITVPFVMDIAPNTTS